MTTDLDSPSNMTATADPTITDRTLLVLLDLIWRWLNLTMTSSLSTTPTTTSTTSSTTTFGVILVATACFAQVLLTGLCPRTYAPRVLSKPSTLSRHVLRAMPRLSTASYRPAGWSDGPHVQTLLAMLLPRADDHALQLEREYLQLADDGIVGLDWAAPAAASTSRQVVIGSDSPIVVVIPPPVGFASVVRATCLGGLEHGFRPVVFQGRGADGTPLTTPRLQSFGDATDFREVVAYVLAKFPDAMLTIVAYGLGNVLLMSYLGEYGSSARVAAAVAVSPVWDAPQLVHHFPQPYGWLLLSLAKQQLRRVAHALDDAVDVHSALLSRSFAELCELVYLPLYGHRNMQEFWDENDPMTNVDDIAAPILVIQALDDPIVSRDSIPTDLFGVYPNFILVLLNAGGHCAFLEGDGLRSWATTTSFEYLTAVLKFAETDTTLKNGK